MNSHGMENLSLTKRNIKASCVNHKLVWQLMMISMQQLARKFYQLIGIFRFFSGNWRVAFMGLFVSFVKFKSLSEFEVD